MGIRVSGRPGATLTFTKPPPSRVSGRPGARDQGHPGGIGSVPLWGMGVALGVDVIKRGKGWMSCFEMLTMGLNQGAFGFWLGG